MKRRLFVLLLAAVMLIGMLPVSAVAADDGSTVSVMMEFPTGHTLRVSSVGRYTNWAGVSNVSQFVDDEGRFCCAADGEDSVTVLRTDHGKIVSTVSIQKTHEKFGGAVCDDSGTSTSSSAMTTTPRIPQSPPSTSANTTRTESSLPRPAETAARVWHLITTHLFTQRYRLRAETAMWR